MVFHQNAQSLTDALVDLTDMFATFVSQEIGPDRIHSWQGIANGLVYDPNIIKVITHMFLLNYSPDSLKEVWGNANIGFKAALEDYIFRR